MHTEQPMPQQNSNAPIWDLVIKDLHEQARKREKDKQLVLDLVFDDMTSRDQVGRKRYGTPLQGFNGRDMLQDAYEEALDLCVYLRGAIYERDMLDEQNRKTSYR